MPTIEVRLGDARIPVERSVFIALFEASVVASRAPYLKAVETSRINFADLVELARTAEIPYTLFFAPLAVVEQQLKNKTNKLLAGVSKTAFSLNSRSRVQLSDVELIVKDLLRKQEELKRLDDSLSTNTLVGCLRRSREGVVADAAKLREALGFSVEEVKRTKTKSAALALLIDRFEAKQLLVSQSQQNYMPQRLPPRAKFSGLCVRDRKIPFIFLTGGDADDNYEPEGRRIFTLVLLAVFVAHSKFAPVTYSDQTEEPITNREYELAEEVLMPLSEIRDLDASTLDAVRAGAATYRVTPSAFVMRARRAGLIDAPTAAAYLAELKNEFASRPKRQPRSPLPINALRRYNGIEFSKRMLHQLDRGAISQGDFCRVVFLNKLKPAQIAQFREAL